MPKKGSSHSGRVCELRWRRIF